MHFLFLITNKFEKDCSVHIVRVISCFILIPLFRPDSCSVYIVRVISCFIFIPLFRPDSCSVYIVRVISCFILIPLFRPDSWKYHSNEKFRNLFSRICLFIALSTDICYCPQPALSECTKYHGQCTSTVYRKGKGF